MSEADKVERRRGHNDALAGHGPALFDGQYMIGYRRGRAEIGDPMAHKPASEDVPCGTIREARLESLLVRALERALPGGLEAYLDDPEAGAAEGQWAQELLSAVRREVPEKVIRTLLKGGMLPLPADCEIKKPKEVTMGTSLMTAVGSKATVDKPGDFAITISDDGDCLTINKHGSAKWAGGISLRQAADAAANTIVKALWGDENVSDTARALVLVRLYDRMDEDAREASLGGARHAKEALAHFKGRPPMIVVDATDEDIQRSVALLRVFESLNSVGRWSALNTLILVGLDVSRKFK